MSVDNVKAATNNKPDVIVTLLPEGKRAQQIWEHGFNKSGPLRHSPQATKVDEREIVVSPDNLELEILPTAGARGLKPSYKPGAQFTFSKPPKNFELGYVLGSGDEVCDMYLGSSDDHISRRMLSISFNEYNEVVMKSSSRNYTEVSYVIQGIGTQQARRKNFTWILLPEVKKIIVSVAGKVQFSVVVPTHDTDKAIYDANCHNFKTLSNSASQTLSHLSFASVPNTKPATGIATSHATAEPSFYLRTSKIGQNNFGTVYKARSMPKVATVALKIFNHKKPWTVEPSVLQQISGNPHDNIIKLIEFDLGDEPYIAMGLALGGNLEDQYNKWPFSRQEIGLILRQMLSALVYLHVEVDMIHGNIKPANILCDSRTHFRLADFALAKEGDYLNANKGAQPYVAPEMFEDGPYTAAVDLWALGAVIARLLLTNGLDEWTGNDGLIWSKGLVSQFEEYHQRFLNNQDVFNVQGFINLLVERYMLKLEPTLRESALECVDRGAYLWWMLDQDEEDLPDDLRDESERQGTTTLPNAAPLAASNGHGTSAPSNAAPLAHGSTTLHNAAPAAANGYQGLTRQQVINRLRDKHGRAIMDYIQSK